MLHLFGHGGHLAVVVGPNAAHDGAVSLPPLVHLKQLVHHKGVARHDGQHQYEQDGGVQVGVDSVVFVHRVHVDEAPRARTVLHVRPETREGEETERRT